MVSFILTALLAFEAQGCQKYLYRQVDSNAYHILCQEDWARIMDGIYVKKCEDGVVVYAATFAGKSPKFAQEYVSGGNVKCKVDN